MPWWLGHPALPDPHAAPSPTRGQHSISDPKPLLEPLLHGFYPFYSITSAMHTAPSWDWGFPRSLEFPLSEHHPRPISVWNSLSQSTAPSQSGIPSQGIIPAHLSLDFPLWAEAENPHRFFQALLFLPGFLILEQHGATWVCELVLGTT